MPTHTDTNHPPPSPTVQFMHTINQVADQTTLGRSTVYREIAAGRLRSVKVGGARRIPHTALLDWLQLLESEST